MIQNPIYLVFIVGKGHFFKGCGDEFQEVFKRTFVLFGHISDLNRLLDYANRRLDLVRVCLKLNLDMKRPRNTHILFGKQNF